LPGAVSARAYPERMPPVSAHDVAVELRRQLPGLPSKKLHKLLYYCQGHHLAHFDEPLFTESVMAWDMGPVVGQLWRAEKDGRPPARTQPLDAGQLNTVGYVVSRYGRLTGHDLELLSHAEDPWRAADAHRPAGGSVRIDTEAIRAFFSTAGGPEPDLPWPAPDDIARLSAGAEQRRQNSPVPDDLSELTRRRAAR
jgi:uncharacterized phage-associated protein